MPWYKVHFTIGEVIDDAPVRLEKQYRVCHVAYRSPAGAALFFKSEGRDTEFFFTPGAAEIAQDLIEQFSGIECEKPDPHDLALVVGDRAAWSLVH